MEVCGRGYVGRPRRRASRHPRNTHQEKEKGFFLKKNSTAHDSAQKKLERKTFFYSLPQILQLSFQSLPIRGEGDDVI